MPYTEEERDITRVYRKPNQFIRGPLVWFSIVSGIIVIGVASFGVYQVRQYIPVIGYIWLASSALLPTIGVLFLLIALVRYAMRADIIEIGPVGTAIRTLFGSVRVLTPLALGGVVSGGTSVQAIQGPRVDTLGDVIEKGYIGVASERFLLGMSSDNAPVYGDWNKIRSVIVAGISGSGKTVTMVFIIVQIMLSKAAHITVVDPHYKKTDGLTGRLKPLARHGTFVHTDPDTIKAVEAVKEALERRIEGEEYDHAVLLVIDEWNRIASRNKEVFELVKWVIEEIAQEGRGFDVYVMLAGQIWQPSKSGGSSIINSFASVYLHRLKRQQSKFLGFDTATQKLSEKLPSGSVFLADANGDTTDLVIPECKYRDAVTVRDMLYGSPKAIGTVEAPLQVEAPKGHVVNAVNEGLTGVNDPVNVGHKRVRIDESVIYPYTPDFKLNTLEIAVNDPVVNVPVNTSLKVRTEDVPATVLRLMGEWLPLGEIAKMVGLAGSQYDKFKAVLKGLNVDPVEYSRLRQEHLNKQEIN